ncbi:hypothetical protein Plhal703r1_c33g0125171 [Plasmopara halstedii]
MLISDEASSFFPGKDAPPTARRIRPNSAQSSFVHQKLHTALSHAEKTSIDLTKGSNALQLKPRASEDVQDNKSSTRYRSTVAVVSFNDSATTFSYHASLVPGIHFYTFLAAKEVALGPVDSDYAGHGSENEERESQRCHRRPDLSALKLNVPDTIVYGETGRGIWIFTDKNGYVQRSTEFNDKQVLEQFSQGRTVQNDKHLIVYKESIVKMSTGGSQAAHRSVCFQGNQLRLLNLGEVKTLLDGVQTVKKSFSLQQFVKFKGLRAFVQRAVFEAGKPSYAWMIRNTEPLSDFPNISRLCTNIHAEKGCTFIKLTERGCAAVSELNLRIVRYVERHLHISIQTFVADFIKDAAGNWWFIQVKAFQAQKRCTALPRKLRKAYLMYRNFGMDDDEEPDEQNRRSRHQSHRKNVIFMKQKVSKLFQCKCCLSTYTKAELSYRMTSNMIYDMHLRIRSQLSPEKTLSFLSNSLVEHSVPELAYESWRVCSFCYAIYERDQHLRRIETKFSEAVGVPSMTTAVSGLSRIENQQLAEYSALPPQLTLCRLVLVIRAIYDIPPELYHAEVQHYTTTDKGERKNLHSSRLYLRISVLGYTECIPINGEDILKAVPKGEHWQENLDHSWSDDDADWSDDTTESICHQTSHSMHQPQSLETHGINYNYWLPMNLLRLIPFFAPNTLIYSKLKDSSAISSILTENDSIRVQLIRATEPPLQDPMDLSVKRRPRNRRTALAPIGSISDVEAMPGPSHSVVLGLTKIRLTQFLSTNVTKLDYFASMTMTGEMLNINGKMGLERIRYVDSKLLSSRHRLRVHNGIFIPDETFISGDALTSEWMDFFRASTYTKRSSSTVNDMKSLTNIEISPYNKAESFPESSLHSILNISSSRASLLDENGTMDVDLELMIEQADSELQEQRLQNMNANLISPSNTPSGNEENYLTKQQLFCDQNQFTNLRDPSIIVPSNDDSPFTQRSNCSNLDASDPSSRSSMAATPRNRMSLWSLALSIKKAHNLLSRERSCCRWECHYTLLHQRRSALERQPLNSQLYSESGHQSRSSDAILSNLIPQVSFSCAHKFWLFGTTNMVQSYLRHNSTLKLYFRNDMYASTRTRSEGEFYGSFELSKLLRSRKIDTTIDIFAAQDDLFITSREVTLPAPSLSLSIQLARVPLDIEEVFQEHQFKEIGSTSEGLRILRKMPIN